MSLASSSSSSSAHTIDVTNTALSSVVVSASHKPRATQSAPKRRKVRVDDTKHDAPTASDETAATSEEKARVVWQDWIVILPPKQGLTLQDVQNFMVKHIVLISGTATVFVKQRKVERIDQSAERTTPVYTYTWTSKKDSSFLRNVVPVRLQNAEGKSEMVPMRKVYENLKKQHGRLRCFDSVDFIPYINSHIELQDIFNLFSGFALLPKVRRSTFTRNDAWVDFYTAHNSLMVSGDPVALDYLLKFQAHIVQYPAQKHRVVPVITGPQGSGKNIYWQDFMCRVLGGDLVLLVNDMDRFVDRFNSEQQGRMLTVMDEVSIHNLKKLKNMLSNINLCVKHKRQEAYTVKNYSRYVMLTNSNWPVRVEAGNTRYFPIQMSPQKVGDVLYFKRFVQSFQERGPEAWFHYLLNMDLTGFNPNQFPQTETLRDMPRISVHTNTLPV